MRYVQRSAVVRRPSPDTLVVLLHGCTATSGRRRSQLQHVVDALHHALPSADVFMPLMPIEFWSLERADDIVDELRTAVDDVWAQQAALGEQYRRVVMVGFSFGSVLLRQLFCRAAGAQADATIDVGRASGWAKSVDRMVLLAGLNRGWTTDSPVSRVASVLNSVGTGIGHLLPREPTLFAIRRGAPFLTRTRLQWLALKRESLTPTLTVQLLGTRDDIVSPADNIDLATGDDFAYVEVPQSGHFEVIQMGGGQDGVESRRRDLFVLAVSGTRDDLARVAVTGRDLLQLLPAEAGRRGELDTSTGLARSPDDVVFVVHGIRDKNYWTRKVARVVATYGRQIGRRVVAVAPSYGYFAMLPFLFPWTRRVKVEWLLDHYVTIRAAHPDARISFVGHSNGTYLLAGAIASCPAATFANVVFAGSVVRSDFDWRPHLNGGQVRRVLNYVATADWVVAIFPRVFQLIRLQDLGGAGHDGFFAEPGHVKDVEYVTGRHNAAIDERHWDEFAAFVLTGTAPSSMLTVGARAPWVVIAGHAAPLIWLVLAAIIVGPIYVLLTALGLPPVPSLPTWPTAAARAMPPWVLAALLMAWTRLMVAILTRL